ncbi:MAG: O-acetylhomoserine aminocarboxypropyltransferase/cysteine synthase, partial [Candidatus Thermoplasmatota archaeon]|nr:O-acetylhomoserine aminocarboxypropyltransferase/cysteine synthase [Candidatus Thermoplasmatota archaeon]
MSDEKYGFDSLLIHSEEKKETKSTTTPIHATASYRFDSADEAAELFELEKDGDIYSRISNPTTREFESRLANIEKGVGSVATSSGMAAISLLVSSLVEKGENIVSSSKLYGGTYNLFTRTLPKWGVKTRLFDEIDEIESKIDEDTKFLHVETIGNPTLEVPDFERISKIAHENGIPLVVDNTFATPYLCNPIEHGADIVWHSTTKWINGHGNAIGGAVIDSGDFDWKDSKFDDLIEPDDAYHGLSFLEEFGEEAFITYLRNKSLRNFGACPSPFNSFLNLTGLETLSVRMEKHCKNAEILAEFLKDHEKVNWVKYPKLKNHV